MKRTLFGTDGIRGLANVWPMTGEVVMAVGRAVAHVLRLHPEAFVRSLPVGLKPLESSRPIRRARIVVGKDTRLSGYMFEQALASGICSMGADVLFIGPLSTPGVAFVTQSMRADAGVMISASHNSYQDNGMKIFSADGFKLPDALEQEIENLVFSETLAAIRPTHDCVGKATRIDDIHGRYVVFLKSLFPKHLDLLGMRIVLDCANGAAYKVAPLVFEELGAEVIRSGVSPDGLNINDKCGALHPESMAALTAKYRADIGIALDGDADRCVFSDENGDIVSGDEILAICALQMHEAGELAHSAIVATPMSNMGLEVALKQRSIELVRAQVGDRYVVGAMRERGLNFGGEQSGHFVFLDHATTGDGIVAALKVLEYVRRTKKPLSELRRCITLYPQVKHDIQVTKKTPFDELDGVTNAIRDVEKKLAGRGRAFVRYSGTEPLLRILVESPHQEEAEILAAFLADVYSKSI